jgi:hypothetical protein
MERRFRPPAGLVAMLRQDFYSRGGSGVRLDYNGTSSDGGQPSRRSLPNTRRTEPLQQPVAGGNEGTRPASTSTEGPTAWAGSVGDTSTVTVGHLELGPGLRVKYVGPGAQDSDAAILMVPFYSAPPSSLLHRSSETTHHCGRTVCPLSHAPCRLCCGCFPTEQQPGA